MTAAADTGFVIIGRNEGERLKRSLRSVVALSPNVVYVDSKSIDGSADFARSLGVATVTLDGEPMTAARARNAGFARLTELWPRLSHVMFVDGDSEVASGFPDTARALLAADPSIGIVAGRCRERDREASIYKRLCDLEWDGPVGEIGATGGIFMTRTDAFKLAGGFNAGIEAAEDDEFCLRIRDRGLKIIRIADEMCVHDANVASFSQWWRRSVRAGRAYAQMGTIRPQYFTGERRRAVIWGFLLPLAILLAIPVTNGFSLLALLLYPLSFLRVKMRLRLQGVRSDDAMLSAAFLTLSKFPNFVGMVDFWRRRFVRRGNAPSAAAFRQAL